MESLLQNSKNFDETKQSYYERNKEKIKANAKKFYLANKERMLAYNKRYYQENKVKIYQKRRFINNPHLQQWYKDNYQKKKYEGKSNIKIYKAQKLHIQISFMGGGDTKDNLVKFN